MKTNEAMDLLIDGLSVAAIFTGDLSAAAVLVQQAQAAGRELTPDEVDQMRKVTAAKRALLEAS